MHANARVIRQLWPSHAVLSPLALDSEEAAIKSRIPGVVGRTFAEMLVPPASRRQPLAGFDDDYADIVDYIVRCTHKIWEERQIDLIRTHYTDDCVIHTLGGEVRGATTVIDNTRATLQAFPDRELIPENVIWSGNDRDSFYSSHRILSPMTNLGASDFGPATGRKCYVRTIADCLVKENRIFEEWLVRDNRWLVMQLGLDAVEVARRQATLDREKPRDAWDWLLKEGERVRAGRASASEAPGTVLAEARERFESLWAAGDSRRAGYADEARVIGPGGRELLGSENAAGLVQEVRAGLTDLRLTVDHLAAVPYPGGGYEVAIRFCLHGRHDGTYLIPATGVDVLILAVTHWRVLGGKITEECTIFDEIAVLRQLFRGTAPTSSTS